MIVNDPQSRLNPTRVSRVVKADSIETVQPGRRGGRGVLCVGCLYFAGMIARNVVQVMLGCQTCWFGGTIARCFHFHFVLATSIIWFAPWHRARLPN